VPTGSALPARVSGSGDALLVDLTRPLEVRQVHLAGLAATLSLHRVDASRLTADPAVQVPNGAALQGPPAQFVATRFGLRATDGAQAQVTGLTPASLDALEVLSRPASPQVLVRDPASAAGPARWLTVFQAAGEIGAAAPSSAGTVDAGAALASALAGAAILPAPPGDTLDVVVLLQSGAPCRFTLSALAIGYRLLSVTFGGTPPGRPSVTLRLAQENRSPDRTAGRPGRGSRAGGTGSWRRSRSRPTGRRATPATRPRTRPPRSACGSSPPRRPAALVDPGRLAGAASGVAVRVLHAGRPGGRHA